MNRGTWVGMAAVAAALALSFPRPAGADDRTELDRLIRIARTQDRQAVWREGERIARRIGYRRAYALLVAAMQETDHAVRLYAAEAIATYGGPVCKDAVAALTKSLTDPDADLRRWSARALGKIGPDAKAAVGELIAALADGEARVRTAAAGGLEGIGPDAKSAAPALVRALDDQAEPVRMMAAYALGAIAPAAKEALPALFAAADSADRPTRQAAVVALGTVLMNGRRGPPAERDKVVAELIDATADADAGVRIHALQGLRWVRPPSKPAVAAIVQAMHDPARRVRVSALGALAYLGDVVRNLKQGSPEVFGPAVPALRGLLGDADVKLRRAAAATLAATVPSQAGEAVGVLIDWLNTERGYPRYHPCLVLAKLGPAAAQAVPGLIQALRDEDAYTRTWAAHALGRIGPRARFAVGALRRAKLDADKHVRRAAGEALKRIRADAKPGGTD